MLVTCNLSGIGSVIKNNNKLIIYPNPSIGNFSVETNTTKKQTLQIFDINGKLVYNQDIINTQTNIDVTKLPEGVYNVSITGYTGIINKRLVIIK